MIRHDAPTAPGSSGGAILNASLKLVGLNFAGATTNSGSFLYGLAIPAQRIHEYLAMNPY